MSFITKLVFAFLLSACVFCLLYTYIYKIESEKAVKQAIMIKQELEKQEKTTDSLRTELEKLKLISNGN